jgi:transglutaminase-like putative cysteine protease
MKRLSALPFGAQVAVSALVALMGALACPSAIADTEFTVKQTFTVKDVPAGAKTVRGWFWMPEDRPEQRVLEFRVTEAPASLRITRDPRYGRSWIYAESSGGDQPLRIVTEFKMQRRAVSGMAVSRNAGQMAEADIRAKAMELRLDEKEMEVTPEIRKTANLVAGRETNIVVQARRFFQYVIDKSEHYSKFGSMPKGLCLGSAKECMAGTGDCCSDQHALFIALCRARGIPCRMMFGSRLKPENEGKDHDPGYRCWPNFYAPGLGWVPLDISSADAATPDQAYNWFGGLDENRVEWAEGRDFDLEPRSAVRPDLVIRGYVEVDGKPHKTFDRVVNFKRQVMSTSADTTTKSAAK